ncbi:MAG: Maf family protein [Acidimicrobiales bacterium]
MDPSRLVLASSSPRRRALLDRLDLAFEVQPADLDESRFDGEAPDDYVRRLASAKADAVAAAGTVVIAADTAVVVDGQPLGKPIGEADAARMLELLSGRAHQVLSGVAVDVDAGARRLVEIERTTVHVTGMTSDRVAWYVGSGEGADKAGGYGLQGAAGLFADHVEGSVSNVLGLPLSLLDSMLRSVGLDLLWFRGES